MTAKLGLKQHGDGRDALVLLHGFGGSAAVWNGLVSMLPRSAGIFAYDLPGHGGSLHAEGAGSAKAAARLILADLAERGIARTHVAGHSMGGAVATLMALSAPERIASLALLAPGGFGAEIAGPLLRRFAAATDAIEVRTCLEAMSAPGFAFPRQAVDACVEARRLPNQTEKLVEIAATITRDDRQGVIPRDMLATLAMPVAVAWGTMDPVLPPAQMQGLPPGFRTERLPGAGHMLIEEAPEQVAALIRSLAGGTGAG